LNHQKFRIGFGGINILGASVFGHPGPNINSSVD